MALRVTVGPKRIRNWRRRPQNCERDAILWNVYLRAGLLSWRRGEEQAAASPLAGVHDAGDPPSVSWSERYERAIKVTETTLGLSVPDGEQGCLTKISC